MGFQREHVSTPLLVAVAIVALAVGGLLAGYEPVSGDPDCLYRPIKGELAKALEHGTLPFWSDHFGLGVPLVGESHAAAFYPPNWLLYRVLSVSSAYRLAMWLHYLALVVATYAYGRVLGLSPWGSALAAVSFALCGFQMSHACHEPFYHLLPYLPLSLMLAERYMAAGRLVDLALLALALGAQFTLGHFQLQSWTAGLVVLTGLWRARAQSLPWRRALGLIVGVGWAGMVASVQLLITWDLTQAAHFDRPIKFLSLYAFPPTHLAQLALPGLYSGIRGPGGIAHWESQQTTPDEASLYLGTIPLILAFSGLLARRDRALGLWRWLALLGLMLSTMPRWYPEGFEMLLHLPILGHFRAPGRYTLLTSLGLCLLAGRGFDRLGSPRRFWVGFGLALVFGIGAIGWGFSWSSWPEVLPVFGADGPIRFLVAGIVVWVVSLALVAAWKKGWVPPVVLLLVASGELAYLYHHGTTVWGWSVKFPEQSPVFEVLKTEADVGLIAGDLQDLPARASMSAGCPNLGIVAPPPNYLLEEVRTPFDDPKAILRSRRFGVTHGIFEGPMPVRACQVLYLGPDPVLDALLPYKATTVFPRLWRVERYPGVYPEARCAKQVKIVDGWWTMYPTISLRDDPDDVIYLQDDRPPDPPGPRATKARIVRWDGRDGEFEHDGTFDLVLRRTFVPGWTARLNETTVVPILPAEGGLQAIRIPGSGSGVTRVRVEYRPVWLRRGMAISSTAVLVAVVVIGISMAKRFGRRGRGEVTS